MSTPSTDLFQPLRPEDPATVGGYRLSAVLGAGGMGKVYLSYTPGGRPIALKVIRPEFSEDPEFRRRFQQEVRAAQRVQGLYTAPVIDFDTEGSQPWLATAYVPGPSLAHAVARHGRLPLRSVLLLTVGVAEALHVIHGAGIVHRDLKPANVLLAGDGPRVIDFGIARAADATSLTGSGVSVGTPAFMAPEQASAGTVTDRTDIFALGQIVAYAAIGAPAYGEGSSHAVLYRIVHEDPDLSALPQELRPLVTRCLSRDPADRPTLTEVIQMCHDLSPSRCARARTGCPRRSPVPSPSASSCPNRRRPRRRSPPWPPRRPRSPRSLRRRARPRTRRPVSAWPPRRRRAPPPLRRTHRPVPPPGRGAGRSDAFRGCSRGSGHGAAGLSHAAARLPDAPRSPDAAARLPDPARSPDAAARIRAGLPRPVARPPPRLPAPAPQRKPKGLIIAGVVVAAVIGLAVIGSLLPDGSGNKAKDGATSSGGSPSGAAPSGGSQDKGQKRSDPTPASYPGINLTANYQLMLADNPPRPATGGNAGVLYNHGDLYFYLDTLFGDTKVGTNNGKLVVLNNSQKGSLETCRAETRYTEKIGLDQLSDGTEICVLSDAGHIAVATYRGKSGAKDPSTYITLDLTIWRNAEEPQKRS